MESPRHGAVLGPRSLNGPDTPEPTEAWVKQAKSMRKYHLHHPFKDSPTGLPWPMDPPETVQKLPDLTQKDAWSTMQTPRGPLLRDPEQQATHPFFQANALLVLPPPVPPKQAPRRRGTSTPTPQQARVDSRATTSEPGAPAAACPADPASARPDPRAHPDQASSSPSLLPQAPLQLQA